MTSEAVRVHLVALDEAASGDVAAMLAGNGHPVQSWPCATHFLASAAAAAPGCVVIDPYAAGVDPDAVQAGLADPAIGLPSVIVTARIGVEDAVRAMRQGAIDVLTGPIDPDRLRAAIAIGGQRLSKARRRAATIRRVHAALNMLSTREREVLEGLTRGWSNKEIARRLDISARTVEIHRANVMEKLDAESLSQALRIAFISQVCGMVNPAYHVD